MKIVLERRTTGHLNISLSRKTLINWSDIDMAGGAGGDTEQLEETFSPVTNIHQAAVQMESEVRGERIPTGFSWW